MIDKLKSTEYFIPFPNTRYYTFFIALFQLIDMSAVCALLNLYGSRRRFPPWTEFASARSPNLYPQYKVKDVTIRNESPCLLENPQRVRRSMKY